MQEDKDENIRETPPFAKATFKVLIVEDHRPTADIIAAELEDHGLMVEVIHDGSQAIRKMLEWRPHLVILDLELPNKNGHEIFHEMQFHKDLRDILVIGNSIHMNSKDDLGVRFYNAYFLTKKEEPLYVNKLESSERMYNNLTAVVAYALSQKYQMLTPSLATYLDEMREKEKKLSKPDVQDPPQT